MSGLRKVLGAQSDIALVLLVIGVLVVLFAPIPASLLDFLILANISFALLLLLLAFYTGKPVEFSTFPSLLLVATLFRLSLNVAATRLILQHGDAGRVIAAVGNLVVGGNYVIGIIVFLILVVVQYVVVTSGAQRVSEVAARFTLDSMPGQQMSIDADLNMGFIDQAEAQRRRKQLSKEAAFYGAMDGASKFVKGDAIAGIVILLVNIIGGLVVGMMQLGMRWDQALHTFTLLTIGDGIVTQVPALVISVGTGLIVTRSATDASLGAEAFKQVTAFPKTLGLVLLALSGALLLPGLPTWPIVALIVLFGLGVLLRRSGAAQAPAAAEDDATKEGADPYGALAVEPIEVLLGVNLVSFLAEDQAAFMERVAAFRQQHAMETGLVVPSVRLKSGARLPENGYEICVQGVAVARSELHRDHVLAIRSPESIGSALQGIETKEPAFGLPAVWVKQEDREVALAARMTLVDVSTVFVTHLCEVLRQHSASLLSRRETERMLAHVREAQPGLVEELVPTVLSITDIQKLLQNLLKERVTVRHIGQIIEALADGARTTKDLGVLTEMVRQRLGAMICQSIAPGGTALQVLTLNTDVEHRLLQALRGPEGAPLPALVVEPKFAEQLLIKTMQQCERMATKNLPPVVLCAPELRRHLRQMTERLLPQLRVLSLAEIPNTAELRAFGTIAL